MKGSIGMIGFCFNCNQRLHIADVAVDLGNDVFICGECYEQCGQDLRVQIEEKLDRCG